MDAVGKGPSFPGARSWAGAGPAPAPARVSPRRVPCAAAALLAALLALTALQRPAAAQVAPDPTSPGGAFVAGSAEHLEFHARDLAVADVLAELRRLVKRNIVVAPDVTARFTGDLYEVTADEILSVLCLSSGLVTRDKGAFIYVENDKPDTRVYTLDHVRADDLMLLIRPLLSPEGQVTATPASKQGIVSSAEEAGGDDYASRDLVIVRDLTSRLVLVDEVVRAADGRPEQVLIEATILAVRLNDDSQFGVDFTVLLGNDFEDAGFTSPDGGLSLVPGSLDGKQLKDGSGNATNELTSTFASGGLSIGYLKGSVAAFVKALQVVTDTTILANPSVVTMNKQRGEVLLGRRDGYLTTTVTQTSTTQSVEFLDTGTRLVFRPFITGDGYVRLEIHPEDSNGGVKSDGLPFKETAEVTTNVMVRDGQTIVIGGLIRRRQEEVEKKVPVLGDVPLLGSLFRSEATMSLREEIVIVLTPRLMRPGTEPPAAAPWQQPAVPPAAASVSPSPAQPWPPVAPSSAPGGLVPPPSSAPEALAPVDAHALARPSLQELEEAWVVAAERRLAAGDAGSAAVLLGALDAGRAAHPDVLQLHARLLSQATPAGGLESLDAALVASLQAAPTSVFGTKP